MNSYFEDLVQHLSKIYEPREARNISKLLFEDVFQINKPEEESTFKAEWVPIYEDAKKRLLQSEPLQYITGRADFYGYVFKVSPEVLIPRPETEELVYTCLQIIKSFASDTVQVLDVGTGSGCIPISLKKEHPSVSVKGIDVSQGALAIAQENARLLAAEVSFQQFDFQNQALWAELGQYDMLVSNPPYIPTKEKQLMESNVLDYEPHLALFVDNDKPLLFYELLAQFCKNGLRPGGHLLVETNQYNAKDVQQLFEQHDLVDVEILQDMMGNDRIVQARKVS